MHDAAQHILYPFTKVCGERPRTRLSYDMDRTFFVKDFIIRRAVCFTEEMNREYGSSNVEMFQRYFRQPIRQMWIEKEQIHWRIRIDSEHRLNEAENR